MLFPYAPNALMLGFIFAVAGTVVGMFASRLVGTVVPVPSIIGAFFTGGVAGIFGNAALGGRRGAMISGFVYGLFLSIPVALFFPLFGLAEYGVTGAAFLVSDGIVALSIMWAFFAAGIPAIGFGLFVVAFGLLSWKFWPFSPPHRELLQQTKALERVIPPSPGGLLFIAATS